MEAAFKVGDVVRLAGNARRNYLSYYDADSDDYKLFSGLMTVTSIRGAHPYVECIFVYPDGHRYAKLPFYFPSSQLELVIQEKKCQCLLQVLMLKGCKCQGA